MKQLPMMRRGVLNRRVVPNARKMIPTCKLSDKMWVSCQSGLPIWEERFEMFNNKGIGSEVNIDYKGP